MAIKCILMLIIGFALQNICFTFALGFRRCDNGEYYEKNLDLFIFKPFKILIYENEYEKNLHRVYGSRVINACSMQQSYLPYLL